MNYIHKISINGMKKKKTLQDNPLLRLRKQDIHREEKNADVELTKANQFPK